MSSLKGTMKVKITSTVLSLATALWLSAGALLIPAAAHGQTVADLQAQIQALLSQIATLQAQLSGLSGGGSTSGFYHVFNTNLSIGMNNSEVAALQQALDLEGCFTFGSYTGYFGPITRDAANCFQNKYASEVLTPLGLTGATGFVGPSSRAKLNALYGVAGGGGTTGGGTVVTGGNLLVAAGVQPKDSLAVQSAAGLPFTVINVTAGSADVTIDTITVERQGLASDNAFSGIILLDENGLRVGLSKSLNSSHQARLTEDVVVKAGQTRTLTIGADMNADLSSQRGETPILAVVGVDLLGGATLQGSLPITGAIHTINATLSIGGITVAIGPLDPGASVNKKVGETGYTFSSVKVTATSAEKLRLMNIRWNQSGSAAATDLANVMTYVDGVSYPATVSSDGKYFTTSFPGGLLIDKGFSKEIYVKGDIVGGSGRTIDFDIFRRQDITLKGETYGYNITAPNGTDTSGTDDGAFHQDTNPWFDAYQVTIDTGTLTVENANTVGAQNVAENIPNQPIAGFNVEVKGEEISVSNIIFHLGVGSSGGANSADLTSISLYNESGGIVAGPEDGTFAITDNAKVTFTESIIFPVGKHAYTLKGKYGTDFSNNDTVSASTTPSTMWTTVTGQTTGQSITPSPASSITGNIMTLKTAAITISVSSVPIAQNVVSGTSGFTFANYQLDATNSGEDIKFASIPLELRLAGTSAYGVATNLTSCKLWDGSTIVSETVDPSAVGSTTVFTFLGTGLVIPKGTVKTVAMKCNVSSGAAANEMYSWGYDTTASPSPTGIQSGQTVAAADLVENDSMGQLMTIAGTGSYTVVDDSTPGYSIVKSGTTGVTLLKLKFSATDENIDLRRVNFQLSDGATTPLTGSATNTPIDLVGQQLTLWDGSTQIGTAVFGAGGDYATSSLIAAGTFIIPANGSKTMTIKGDISGISVSGPLSASGDLVIVDYDGGANGLNNGNYGVGLGSASNVSPSSSDTNVAGVRILKAYPSFAKIDLDSSETSLITGSDRTMYKFKVTAVGGDVQFYKFTFQVSSSTGTNATATTSKYSLYAYTDSAFSNVDSAFSSTGILNAAQCYYPGAGFGELENFTNSVGLAGVDIDVFMDKTSTACDTGGTATTTYKVPSGETRWFRFAADVANVETQSGTESFEVRLMGDAAYPTVVPDPVSGESNNAGLAMGSATAIDTDTNDDLIWSPVSTTTNLAIADLDFTNGYQVAGLPGTNMSHNTLTSAN